MFSTLSNWVFIGAVAGALSACGGGGGDSYDHGSAAGAPLAAPVHAEASGASADTAVNAAPAGGVDVQLAYIGAPPAPLASPAEQQAALSAVQGQSGNGQPALPAHQQVALASMHGGGASVASQQALIAQQQARLAELAAAEQAARMQAAMSNPGDEEYQELLRTMELERQTALNDMNRIKPSDPGCISPRWLYCAN